MCVLESIFFSFGMWSYSRYLKTWNDTNIRRKIVVCNQFLQLVANNISFYLEMTFFSCKNRLQMINFLLVKLGYIYAYNSNGVLSKIKELYSSMVLNVTSYNITSIQNVKFGHCLQAMNNFNQSMILPFKCLMYIVKLCQNVFTNVVFNGQRCVHPHCWISNI
jgi:hypothetical protein